MERRNSIRAAIQGLLTQAPHSEQQPIAFAARSSQTAGAGHAVPCACTSGLSARVFGEIQAELREHGIAVEISEIAQAILETVGARPALCRGLFAEYLMDGS